MFDHFAHVFAAFCAWYGILILSTLRGHSHRPCLRTKMQGTQMKIGRFRDVFLNFFKLRVAFLEQRVMLKMPQIIIAKRYGYNNDDELIMGVSQREHFQNNLRIFNAATLTQYAVLKEKEKRMQKCILCERPLLTDQTLKTLQSRHLNQLF